MNAAELFVKALESEGVEHVFGIPGDENLHVVEAIRKSEKIQFVLTRHEQAAGFMAATYGRLTGTVAVALSTLGAGASNLVTSVADAYLGATPMLVVTGQKAIRDNHQGQYQLLDVVSMMRPITKYARTVPSGAAVPAMVHEALHLALAERQGPVHLELPDDIMLDDGDHPVLPMNRAQLPVAAEEATVRAAQLITEARRPLVLVGGGTRTNRPDVSASLRAFLTKTGIPFVATMMGKGVAEERGPQYLGTTVMPSDYANCAIGASDVLLNVGHDVMEKPPFVMKNGDGRMVIHLNSFSAHADPTYFPQHQVVGDMAQALDHLAAHVAPQDHWELKQLMKAGVAMQASIARGADDASAPAKPQYVTRVLREFLGDEDIVSVDNGIHMMWLTRNYPAYEANSMLVDHALGSMGISLPAAIAAKMAHPERKVVVVTGDGGFMMNSQELETAVRLSLDLVVLIFNDNGLGMIRLKQAMDGYGNLGVDFGNPDFVAYAKSFGAHGHRLEDPSKFRAVLEECTQHGGVHVVDIPIDTQANIALMKEMKSVDCSKVLG